MSDGQYASDYFPPIKTMYGETYSSPRGQVMSYQERGESGRIREFEGRLEAQERATRMLMEAAVKVKEDMTESLVIRASSKQEDREVREVLQEHVRSITAGLRKVNKDIETLAGQIKEKENHLTGTGQIVRQIETNQISSIGDLRGRVGRCDSFIAKLASDVRQLNESMKLISVSSQESNNKVIERLQAIDLKNQDITSRIDRLNSESNSNLRISVEETNKHLTELDFKTKHALDELSHQIKDIYLQDQSQLDKLETKVMTSSEKTYVTLLNRIEKLEDTLNSDRHHSIILERLENFENDYKNFRKDRINFEKELEQRLTNHSDRLYRQQIDDLSRFKREVRDGFAAIHETINNMKSVVEGKQRLSEENLRKEMAQLRKMVVLI